MNRLILVMSLALSFNAFSQEVLKNDKFVKIHSEAVVGYPVADLLKSESFSLFEDDGHGQISGRLYLNVPKDIDGLKVLDAKIPKIKDIAGKNCDIEIADGQRFVASELELTLVILPRKGGSPLNKESAEKCFIAAIKNEAFMSKINFEMEFELADTSKFSSDEKKVAKAKKKASASAQ